MPDSSLACCSTSAGYFLGSNRPKLFATCRSEFRVVLERKVDDEDALEYRVHGLENSFSLGDAEGEVMMEGIETWIYYPMMEDMRNVLNRRNQLSFPGGN